MAKKAIQIHFKFDGSGADIEKSFADAAKPIIEHPGLKWKIWCWNEDSKEFCGEYIFENEESVKAYLETPIMVEAQKHPSISNVSVKSYDVMEGLTAVTKGPV